MFRISLLFLFLLFLFVLLLFRYLFLFFFFLLLPLLLTVIVTVQNTQKSFKRRLFFLNFCRTVQNNSANFRHRFSFFCIFLFKKKKKLSMLFLPFANSDDIFSRALAVTLFQICFLFFVIVAFIKANIVLVVICFNLFVFYFLVNLLKISSCYVLCIVNV